jgi:hypothetical protein
MKAAGPDGIINRALHVATAQIAPHLTKIFNWSLRLGYFRGDDEVGYYDDDDYDDGRTSCADGAIGSEAFDSCWDRNS